MKHEIRKYEFVLAFGIFSLVFIALCLLALLNLVFRAFADRNRLISLIYNKLNKSLYYNAWIRFLIQSNIELVYTSLLFLKLMASFSFFFIAFKTLFFGSQLAIALLFPFLALCWLYKNKERLYQSKVLQKYESLYMGTKAHTKLGRLYTPLFCLRRASLCFLLIFMGQGKSSTVLCFIFI